jgi:hypothetical protein
LLWKLLWEPEVLLLCHVVELLLLLLCERVEVANCLELAGWWHHTHAQILLIRVLDLSLLSLKQLDLLLNRKLFH